MFDCSSVKVVKKQIYVSITAFGGFLGKVQADRYFFAYITKSLVTIKFT